MPPDCLSAFANRVMAVATWRDNPPDLNAECLSAIANSVMAGTALAALLLAYLTIKESRATQREATAKELWRDYEAMAFANPIFADPGQHHPEIEIAYEARTIEIGGDRESLARTIRERAHEKPRRLQRALG